MNKLAMVVLLVSSVGLAACNRKKPEEGREPAQATGTTVGSAAAPAPTPAPTAPAPAPSAEATGSAGSAAGSGEVAKGGTACDAPTTMTCDAKLLSDGCVGNLTTVHACVAKDAKAGGACGDGATLTCPEGQADGCLGTPPVAKNHVCVVVAKPTP